MHSTTPTRSPGFTCVPSTTKGGRSFESDRLNVPTMGEVIFRGERTASALAAPLEDAGVEATVDLFFELMFLRNAIRRPFSCQTISANACFLAKATSS